MNKNLHIPAFLRNLFGPDYCPPPLRNVGIPGYYYCMIVLGGYVARRNVGRVWREQTDSEVTLRVKDIELLMRGAQKRIRKPPPQEEIAQKGDVVFVAALRFLGRKAGMVYRTAVC